MSKQSSDDTQKLDILIQLTLERLDQLLDFFSVRYQNLGGRLHGPCPLHNGKNPHAFNIYTNTGIWGCFTRHCEKNKGKTLLGLVRALLSKELNKKYISNIELIDFLTKFTEANLSNLKIDPHYKDKKEFAAEFNKINKEAPKGRADRRYVRSKLVIPAEYYIKRDYSTEVLNEFDIGLCIQPDMPLVGRVIVPIYDQNDYLIGCTARVTDNSTPKWVDSGKLVKTSILYGYWKALNYIKGKNSVIIVESPGNLWRLWDSGYRNVISLLGSHMSAEQFNLINSLGISELILLLDNDDAGKTCCENIVEMSKKLYKISEIKIAESPFSARNDVGDLSITEVKELFKAFKVFNYEPPN